MMILTQLVTRQLWHLAHAYRIIRIDLTFHEPTDLQISDRD